jgi:CHAD domain-containing protein
METVYYDTPDLRLARWGVSLRYRAGEGWTLKLPPAASRDTPGQLLERDELTFQGGSKKPPEAAVDIVRAYVRKAELVPVARLSTIRRRVRLVDATGARVAEVVDDEVSVRDGRRVAARFREIEVEVSTPQNGANGMVDSLVTRLRGAGAGAPDPTPKHVRALGPRAMEAPEVTPVPVRPDSPARDVIKSVLAESIASFGPLLNAEWTEPLRSELGWLAMGLGAVRDREVLLERLRARAKSLPEADLRSANSLLHILEVEIDTLRKKLLAELSSVRYVDLLERLVEAAHSPATLPEAEQPASAVLPPLAAGPWRRLRSAVRQLPDPPTDPELHRIRILAKRARYAAEAVAPIAGSAAARFARAAAKLQTVLGEHQDSVTAQAWLRSARTSGRRAFVAGELIAMEHIAAEEARAKWPKAWKALNRKQLRGWMP